MWQMQEPTFPGPEDWLALTEVGMAQFLEVAAKKAETVLTQMTPQLPTLVGTRILMSVFPGPAGLKTPVGRAVGYSVQDCSTVPDYSTSLDWSAQLVVWGG